MTTVASIEITANGRAFTRPAGLPLTEFLTELGFAPGLVVVERNRQALTPAEARQTVLEDGDRLEIVRITAGG